MIFNRGVDKHHDEVMRTHVLWQHTNPCCRPDWKTAQPCPCRGQGQDLGDQQPCLAQRRHHADAHRRCSSLFPARRAGAVQLLCERGVVAVPCLKLGLQPRLRLRL